MSVLKIVTFPDSKLREKSKEVEKIDENIKNLVDDMIETMIENKGLGLAAIQVGIPLRIFIVDWRGTGEDGENENKDHDIRVFINPVILNLDEKFIMENEGCLSLPDLRADIERFYKTEIEAFDINGKKFKLKAEDILSVALQHEYEHLEGKLFIDKLSPVKRSFLLKEYKKKRKKKSE